MKRRKERQGGREEEKMRESTGAEIRSGLQRWLTVWKQSHH